MPDAQATTDDPVARSAPAPGGTTSTSPDPAHEAPFAAEVIRLACRAPSMHNVQPWAWRSDHPTLELWADHGRQLPGIDPRGRNLIISCGAALHHARVAASGLGWHAEVARWPDGPDADVLARLRLAPAPPAEHDLDGLETLQRRQTDRRRFTTWPVSPERLRELVGEAARWGVRAVVVADVVERLRVERLLGRADRAGSSEATAAVSARRHRPLPPEGLLEEDEAAVRGADGVLVLCTTGDGPAAWLAVGEALSAVWLRAVRAGLSVVPLSSVVEVEETRTALHHDVLHGGPSPQLILRLGWQALSRSDLPLSPRRPLAEVLRA